MDSDFERRLSFREEAPVSNWHDHSDAKLVLAPRLVGGYRAHGDYRSAIVDIVFSLLEALEESACYAAVLILEAEVDATDSGSAEV